MRWPLVALSLVVVACGHGATTAPDAATTVPTATPAALLERLRPFAGKAIWTVELMSAGVDATTVGGVQLDVAGSSVTLRIFDREQRVLGGPYELTFDAANNVFSAPLPSLLGKVGTEIAVGVEDATPDEMQVLFYRARARPASLLPGAVTKSARARRDAFARHVSRFHDVPGITGLDRLADILQTIADTDYETFMIQNPPPAATWLTGAPTLVHVILEDAIDVLSFGNKQLKLPLMVVFPHEEFIFRAEEIPQTGMKPRLNVPNGNGRARHLLFNALASLNVPDFIVSFVAKAQGHDFEHPLKDLTGEDLADVTVNEIGRRFAEHLKLLSSTGRLGDGHSVRDWIRAEMGSGTPAPDLEAQRAAAEKLPAGEIQLTVDLGTNQAYATAQLFIPKNEDERKYVADYLKSVYDDMIQPDLLPGQCAEHKYYPAPAFRSLAGFVATGPITIGNGATRFFSLNPEGDGRFQSPYATLTLPMPPLLDLEMAPAVSLPDTVPGLVALGVTSPDLSADFLNYDPAADYPMSFSVGAGTMMARLAGSKVIECKATAAAPSVTVSKADLAKFAGGSILFRHLRMLETRSTFPSPGRVLQMRAQTTRSLSLTAKK